MSKLWAPAYLCLNKVMTWKRGKKHREEVAGILGPGSPCGEEKKERCPKGKKAKSSLQNC